MQKWRSLNRGNIFKGILVLKLLGHHTNEKLSDTALLCFTTPSPPKGGQLDSARVPMHAIIWLKHHQRPFENSLSACKYLIKTSPKSMWKFPHKKLSESPKQSPKKNWKIFKFLSHIHLKIQNRTFLAFSGAQGLLTRRKIIRQQYFCPH